MGDFVKVHRGIRNMNRRKFMKRAVHSVQGLGKWKWSRSVVSDSLQPMDCSPPSSSVHGIFQARLLEWVAISFSRGSSQPRDWTWVSCTAGRLFTVWATREALSWQRNWPRRTDSTGCGCQVGIPTALWASLTFQTRKLVQQFAQGNNFQVSHFPGPPV